MFLRKLGVSKFVLIFLIFINFESLAATIDVDINGANLSSATTNDTINFTQNGSLAVDTDETLAEVTAASTDLGIINFNDATSRTLTISGDVGSSSNNINSVTFNEDGELVLQGDIHTSSGITSDTNSQGSITLSGSSSQTISTNIGSASLRIKDFNIVQSNGAVLNNDIYSTNFTSSGSSTLSISGSGNLDFSNTTISGDTVLGTSSNISLGSTTISGGQTLQITSSDANITDLSLASSSILQISASRTVNISGDLTGTGSIVGDTNAVGNFTLSGSDAQSVGANIELGQSSSYLNNLAISNVNETGVTLNNDVYVSSISFTNDSDTSNVNIVSSKTINISGDITQTSGGDNIITGDGKVDLNGSGAQNIAANFGSSTSARLAELEISNSSSSDLTLSGNAYLTNFRSSTTASSVNFSAILNASNSFIENDLTLSGSGTLSLGATTISDNMTLTLDNDASLSTLALGSSASSDLVISSSHRLTVTSNITGVSGSTILGSANNVGNISFTGLAAQSVASDVTLGSSSSYLNDIAISNVNNVTLNSDTYSNSLSFTNSSSTSKLILDNNANFTILGDISQSSSGSSQIYGTSGSLTLAGSSQQNVNSALGTSTTRLGTLVINNSSGVVLNEDSYLNDLTLTSGTLNIAGDKNIDVFNAIDLSSKSISLASGSAGFGKLSSSNAGVSIDDSTTINFDYSNNTTDLDFSGGTSYNIIESNSGITGNIANVNVSDNSFLFDNSLAINGNNIVTSINVSSNFNESRIGVDNFNLINNAISNTDLSSGLASIATASELDDALETLKPMQNGAFIQETLSIMDNMTKLVFEKYHHIDFANKKDSSSEKYYGFWSKVFGGIKKQNDDGDVRGYDSTMRGLALGIDKKLSNFESNNIIGFALGIANSSIDGNSDSAQNDDKLNSYNLTFYNSNSNENSLGLYNENSLNYAFNDYQTSRNIVVGTFEDSVKSDFNGSSILATSLLGYRIKLNNNLLIAPNLAFKYLNIAMDDYEEKGAGDNGLRVQNDDYDNIISRIGVDFAYKINYFNNDLLSKFNLYFESKLNDAKHQQQISFVGGGSFVNNNSIDVQKNKFGVDFGLNIFNEKDHYVDLNYNLELANKFYSHIGAFEYRYEF